MNKEYIYKDGKALIVDQDDKQKTVDYQDNLDKILVQENLIEVMEDKIAKLENETSYEKKENKFSKFLWIFGPFLTFTLVPLIFCPLVADFYNLDKIINNPLFGSIDSGLFMGIGFSAYLSIPGALMSLGQYVNLKSNKKEKKGKETQLEYLKKALIGEKENLETLKSNKTNSKTKEEFFISKINNKESLKELRSFLAFYYDLGYNEQKYFKYYQQGKLDNHLSKFTNETGIELANEHFEEKGPTLVKTRNKK